VTIGYLPGSEFISPEPDYLWQIRQLNFMEPKCQKRILPKTGSDSGMIVHDTAIVEVARHGNV